MKQLDVHESQPAKDRHTYIWEFMHHLLSVPWDPPWLPPTAKEVIVSVTFGTHTKDHYILEEFEGQGQRSKSSRSKM